MNERTNVKKKKSKLREFIKKKKFICKILVEWPDYYLHIMFKMFANINFTNNNNKLNGSTQFCVRWAVPCIWLDLPQIHTNQKVLRCECDGKMNTNWIMAAENSQNVWMKKLQSSFFFSFFFSRRSLSLMIF